MENLAGANPRNAIRGLRFTALHPKAHGWDSVGTGQPSEIASNQRAVLTLLQSPLRARICVEPLWRPVTLAVALPLDSVSTFSMEATFVSLEVKLKLTLLN